MNAATQQPMRLSPLAAVCKSYWYEGLDTQQIAAVVQVSEAEAYNALAEGRGLS